MCLCEYVDSFIYCDECNSEQEVIKVGSEVSVDHPKYGTPVWAQVEEIDEKTGEVFCVGDDGEEYYASSVNDLHLYP